MKDTYDEPTNTRPESDYFHPPNQSLVEQVQTRANLIERQMTQAIYHSQADPAKCTMTLVALVQDFRQLNGMLNEVMARSTMAESELSKMIGAILDNHSNVRSHLLALGVKHE